MAKANLHGRLAKDASTEQGLCGRSRSASSRWGLKVCNYHVLSYWIQNGRRSYVWVSGSANGGFCGAKGYLARLPDLGLTVPVVARKNPGLKSETWATHFWLLQGKLMFRSSRAARGFVPRRLAWRCSAQ
jgi:hypothetical protein